jgi:hypothetical protein
LVVGGLVEVVMMGFTFVTARVVRVVGLRSVTVGVTRARVLTRA